jgi:hypothetical protein
MPWGVAVAAIGTIASGAISASAAGDASDAQVSAADRSSQLQALQFQQSRQDMAPWRAAGGAALQKLADLYGLGNITSPGLTNASGQMLDMADFNKKYGGIWNEFQGGATPWAQKLKASGVTDPEAVVNDWFSKYGAHWRPGESPSFTYAQADPNDAKNRQSAAFADFQTSPDYNFRLTEGLKALDKSAAARGDLFSGNQLKSITDYGQGLASTEYGNYVARLQSMSGEGQTATTNTAQLGALSAGQQGQSIQNAGLARASGYVGQANAFNSSAQGLTSALGYYGGQNNWWQGGGGSGFTPDGTFPLTAQVQN